MIMLNYKKYKKYKTKYINLKKIYASQFGGVGSNNPEEVKEAEEVNDTILNKIYEWLIDFINPLTKETIARINEYKYTNNPFEEEHYEYHAKHSALDKNDIPIVLNIFKGLQAQRSQKLSVGHVVRIENSTCTYLNNDIWECDRQFRVEALPSIHIDRYDCGTNGNVSIAPRRNNKIDQVLVYNHPCQLLTHYLNVSKSTIHSVDLFGIKKIEVPDKKNPKVFNTEAIYISKGHPFSQFLKLIYLPMDITELYTKIINYIEQKKSVVLSDSIMQKLIKKGIYTPDLNKFHITFSDLVTGLEKCDKIINTDEIGFLLFWLKHDLKNKTYLEKSTPAYIEIVKQDSKYIKMKKNHPINDYGVLLEIFKKVMEKGDEKRRVDPRKDINLMKEIIKSINNDRLEIINGYTMNILNLIQKSMIDNTWVYFYYVFMHENIISPVSEEQLAEMLHIDIPDINNILENMRSEDDALSNLNVLKFIDVLKYHVFTLPSEIKNFFQGIRSQMKKTKVDPDKNICIEFAKLLVKLKDYEQINDKFIQIFGQIQQQCHINSLDELNKRHFGSIVSFTETNTELKHEYHDIKIIQSLQYDNEQLNEQMQCNLAIALKTRDEIELMDVLNYSGNRYLVVYNSTNNFIYISIHLKQLSNNKGKATKFIKTNTSNNFANILNNNQKIINPKTKIIIIGDSNGAFDKDYIEIYNDVLIKYNRRISIKYLEDFTSKTSKPSDADKLGIDIIGELVSIEVNEEILLSEKLAEYPYKTMWNVRPPPLLMEKMGIEMNELSDHKRVFIDATHDEQISTYICASTLGPVVAFSTFGHRCDQIITVNEITPVLDILSL